MERLNQEKADLRKFGFTMGIAFLAITLFILIRHKHSIMPYVVASGTFFIFASVMPDLLKPLYLVWMRLAWILSWFNTRLILLLIFYLVFSPVGLLMMIFGKDPLERRIEKDKVSYWKEKKSAAFNRATYERQF